MKNYLNNLNKRLQFQILEENQNDDGSMSYNWVDDCVLWGNIDSIKGSTDNKFGKVNTNITHLIIIRYNDDITVAQRIVFNNRYFYINYILNPNEANKYLEIYCEEKI